MADHLIGQPDLEGGCSAFESSYFEFNAVALGDRVVLKVEFMGKYLARLTLDKAEMPFIEKAN
jgi:hypothetical protein